MGWRRLPALLTVGCLVLFASACGPGSSGRAPPSALDDDAITVGSFDFAESELLAEVYGQALEAAGFTVVRAFRLGPREFVGPALLSGLVELVPEYAGTALSSVSLGAAPPGDDVGQTHAALVHALRDQPVTVLRPAAAQDANAFVATTTAAAMVVPRTLSGLAAVASELTFGGPPECASRPLCLVGLREVYGVEFKEVLELDAGGPVTEQALRTGAVDVALLFTTAPALGDPSLVELVDDRGLQPPENVTPLLRTEVVDRWGPRVVEVLDAVSARLTTDGLRAMNAELLANHAAIESVASAWLTAEGLQ